MNRNPTSGSRSARIKGARPDSWPDPRIDVKSKPFGLTTLSDAKAVRKTKSEIWRTAEAIKQAGCRDVLIIGTEDYLRFIVTIKFPTSR